MEEIYKMKKIVALLIALVMMISVCACTQNAEPANTDEPVSTTPAQTTEPTADPAAAEPTAEPANQHFDKLTLEFVPSKDADVIIAGTQNLPELVKAEMAKLGYDIDEVDITVGTSYDATGEAMSAGSIDLGWLPGGTYALYSDDTDVILTATRNGLSNDSTNPADWNGEANATKKDGPQVTYYRSLIYAAPTEYGKKLAEKVDELREKMRQNLIESIDFLKELLKMAREVLTIEKEENQPEDRRRQARAALTELFESIKSPETPIIVENVVNDIDMQIVEIVRKFRETFETVTGQNEVKKRLRSILWLKYQIKDPEVFEKAYSYVEQYYN